MEWNKGDCLLCHAATASGCSLYAIGFHHQQGWFDFVSQESVLGWKRAFNHKFLRFKTLDGCSHHKLEENGSLYGEIVGLYITEYD